MIGTGAHRSRRNLMRKFKVQVHCQLHSSIKYGVDYYFTANQSLDSYSKRKGASFDESLTQNWQLRYATSRRTKARRRVSLQDFKSDSEA